MNATQQKDLANFNKAKQIALTIEPGCRRHADGTLNNPFYGGNFGGSPMVVWNKKDAHLTKAKPNGRIEFDGGDVFYFKRVAEYTILQG